MKSLSGKADYIVHTGDFVEYSKYEEEWRDRLEKIHVRRNCRYRGYSYSYRKVADGTTENVYHTWGIKK